MDKKDSVIKKHEVGTSSIVDPSSGHSSSSSSSMTGQQKKHTRQLGHNKPKHGKGSTLNLGGSKSPPQPLDAVQRIMGSFGKYHFALCFLIFLCKFPMGSHQMAILFLAPKTNYTCNGVTNACPCPNPVYDTKIFTSTIISRWNLICDKKWFPSLTQMLFQFGVLIGSIVFGMISDRFGRRMPITIAVTIQFLTGVGAAFMPGYWSFTLTRFFLGLSIGGTMVISFVIMMEFVGAMYREILSALYQVPFNIGHMSLPFFSYLFRDYQDYQLALSVPTAGLLCYFCFLPETPRWLIAAKRTDEAIKVLTRVAQVNKRPVDNIKTDVQAFQAAAEKNRLKKGNLLDLFKTPNLRKHILAMAFNWFSCSYCFYGVSQYIGELSGNVFANVAASASVTLLGTLLSIPLMKFVGRKRIVISFNFICATCLFALAVMPAGVGSIICASIGVVSGFIVFVVVYLYCTELFPTVVRTAAVGFSSMCARIGSMIAPFVIRLQDTAAWLPPLVFAVMPLIAGFVAFILPETKGCELMTTLEEGEKFGAKPKADNK